MKDHLLIPYCNWINLTTAVIVECYNYNCLISNNDDDSRFFNNKRLNTDPDDLVLSPNAKNAQMYIVSCLIEK